MQIETVLMAYEYAITYEHPEHREELINQLTKEPSFGYFGAGVTKGGKVGHFSIKLKGRGRQIKEKEGAHEKKQKIKSSSKMNLPRRSKK